VSLTTAEMLALAVLQGKDRDAVAPLWDAVGEAHGFGLPERPFTQILPALKVDCPPDRLRVAVFLTPEHYEPSPEWTARLIEGVAAWVRGETGQVAVLPSVIDRIELYEMPVTQRNKP